MTNPEKLNVTIHTVWDDIDALDQIACEIVGGNRQLVGIAALRIGIAALRRDPGLALTHLDGHRARARLRVRPAAGPAEPTTQRPAGTVSATVVEQPPAAHEVQTEPITAARKAAVEPLVIATVVEPMSADDVLAYVAGLAAEEGDDNPDSGKPSAVDEEAQEALGNVRCSAGGAK